MIRIRSVATGVLSVLLVLFSDSASAEQLLPGPVFGPGGSGVTEQDVLDANRDVYEGLFAVPWDIDTADYDILSTTQYTGQTGSFAGVNDLGMSFIADVTVAASVDYTQLGLQPSEVSYLQSVNAAFANIEVTLSTGLASYDVSAKTVSFLDGTGTLQNKLVVGYYLDTGADGIPWPQEPGTVEPGCWVLQFECVTYEYPCVADTPDCNQCTTNFQTKLAEIESEYNNSVTTAQNTLTAAKSTNVNCKTTARNVYLTASATIEALYVGALVACAFTGPWAPGCVVAATAASTSAQIGAAVTYAFVVDGCNTELAIAQTSYNASMAAAESKREADETIAEQAYQECLDNYGCITTCTFEVCTWIYIWYPECP